jgi:phage portal protein BeeE
MSQTLVHLSTNRLTITLADVAGVAVTGATVTAAVVSQNGTAMTRNSGTPLGALTLNDADDGTYTATVPHDLDVRAGERVRVEVSSVKAGVHRYAEITATVTLDRD